MPYPAKDMTSGVEHVVALPDDRRLGMAEYGDPRGAPVFAFHGLPGSRRQRHPDDAIAALLGARMLHLDRPGFGHSGPQPSRTLLDWATDVRHVCDALKLDRVRVVGVSAGGPYALVCAATLGERVVRTAVVSGVGPPGSMPRASFPALIRAGFAFAPRAPWSVRPFALVAAALARRAPERYIDAVAARMNAADREILARPAVRAMFVEDLREAFAQSSAALAQDLAIIAARWPFELGDIRSPLALWHGEADRMIPCAGAQAVVQAVPHAKLHLVPDAGHFLALDRWREILAWTVG
jgi:pimeloyl-ACP methyl ester carboxylesterase